jgi:hypothetical protein
MKIDAELPSVQNDSCPEACHWCSVVTTDILNCRLVFSNHPCRNCVLRCLAAHHCMLPPASCVKRCGIALRVQAPQKQTRQLKFGLTSHRLFSELEKLAVILKWTRICLLVVMFSKEMGFEIRRRKGGVSVVVLGDLASGEQSDVLPE